MSGDRIRSNASARHVALLLHLSRMVCQVAGRVRWRDLIGEDRSAGERAAETARDGLEDTDVV